MSWFYARLRCSFDDGHYVTLWLGLQAEGMFCAATALAAVAEGYEIGANARMLVEEITSREPSAPASEIHRTAKSAANFIYQFKRRQ